MSKLATISIAVAFAAMAAATPSFAAKATNMGDHQMTFHGKTIMVHVMKMANGQMMYALSKDDLETVFDQKIKDQQMH